MNSLIIALALLGDVGETRPDTRGDTLEKEVWERYSYRLGRRLTYSHNKERVDREWKRRRMRLPSHYVCPRCGWTPRDDGPMNNKDTDEPLVRVLRIDAHHWDHYYRDRGTEP